MIDKVLRGFVKSNTCIMYHKGHDQNSVRIYNMLVHLMVYYYWESTKTRESFMELKSANQKSDLRLSSNKRTLRWYQDLEDKAQGHEFRDKGGRRSSWKRKLVLVPLSRLSLAPC
jgi:hypothetical protein